MRRNRLKASRKPSEQEYRGEAYNIQSSAGDWFPLPNRELPPEVYGKRDSSQTAVDSGEDVRAGLISEDELSHISFPKVGFCDGGYKQEVPTRQPRIVDLCKEDKQRITQLIKELSRCKEEQNEKTAKVKTLSDENEELKNKLTKLEKEMFTLKTAMRYSDENLKMLSKSFAVKEMNYKKENIELQNNISSLVDEKNKLQLKMEEGRKQMDQLTTAIYNVSIENKMINKKYDHTKEKLKAALETVSKIESEFEQKNLQKENKSSQTDLNHVKVLTPRGNRERRRDQDARFHRGSSWRHENYSRESSDEDSLVSELFFIPKQKNLHKSQYSSEDEFY